MARQRTTSVMVRGFTLVEGLVTVAVASVIGTILVTMLQMNGQCTSDGALNAKVQMQYETVIAQISATARRANAILPQDESWPPIWNIDPLSTGAIMMFNDNGAAIGGYRVNGIALQEYIDGSWQNFSNGTEDIQVVSGSAFALSGDRKWLTVNLNVFAVYCGRKDTVTSKQEVLLCRN
ncbi:MAG: type II secretion system protein [Chitinispirillaceae bacterium]|nr:type II secretion system protein [Chitinispirillaceae bacterium]